MTDGTQEPNTEEGESETPSSTLEGYRKIVCAHGNPDETAESANAAAYGISLIAVPALALGLDWTGLWPAIGLGVAAPIALGIGTSLFKQVSSWFTESRLGALIANVVPMLGLGGGLAAVFEPSWVGLAFGFGIAMSFVLTNASLHNQQAKELEALKLLPVLRDELKTFSQASIHPRVLTAIESAFESRGHLVETVSNTLNDDPLVDGVGTLHEVDAALAEMLDRAVPLSVLLTRRDDGRSGVEQDTTQADVLFQGLRAKIDDVSNATLGYAGTRDASVLESLRERMHDLSHTRGAQKELERLN